MLVGFAGHLPLSLGLAVAGVALCNWGAIANTHWPKPDALMIILGGSFLVLGALAVAWSEKQLHSEYSYQYHTMALLFGHAERWMDRELKKMETCLKHSQDPRLPGIALLHWRLEFSKQLRRIQAFLIAVGKESLDENAEWLMLHRARPLEPVFAG